MLFNRGSMIGLFVLALGCRSSRLQPRNTMRRSKNDRSTDIDVVALMSGNFGGFAPGVWSSMTSNGVLEIVQMDRFTESGGTRAFGFNTGERQGWITGWFRTAFGFGTSMPVRYGGALKIAVGESGKVQVANFYTSHTSNPGAGVPFSRPVVGGLGNIHQTEQITYYPDEVICAESFIQLVMGRRYAYLGGCRFIDVTPDNVPNVLTLLPAICEGLAEDRFQDCASFFLCALDELKFTPNPVPELFGAVRIHGQSSAVAPRRTCDPNGVRPGLQHALELCFDPDNAQASNCDAQGKCAYCGEQGLCCKHPGRIWFGSTQWYNESLESDGCGKRGCSGKFCCVEASSQDQLE